MEGRLTDQLGRNQNTRFSRSLRICLWRAYEMPGAEYSSEKNTKSPVAVELVRDRQTINNTDK